MYLRETIIGFSKLILCEILYLYCLIECVCVCVCVCVLDLGTEFSCPRMSKLFTQMSQEMRHLLSEKGPLYKVSGCGY